MERYAFKDGKKLRCGYTTGTCAAAAAKGAAELLLRRLRRECVELNLPDGTMISLPLEWDFVQTAERCGKMEKKVKNENEVGAKTGQSAEKSAENRICTGRGGSMVHDICGDTRQGLKNAAVCAVRKDAGDDADVTDGMLICARVTLYSSAEGECSCAGGKQERPDVTAETETRDRWLKQSSGNSMPDNLMEKAGIWDHGREPDGCDGTVKIYIDGGEGVGRVTKSGLDRVVGEAAINTVPRRMISEAVMEVCKQAGYEGAVYVTIFVPAGRTAAAKTMNSVLGIEGGISILGTSGLVEPMSSAALIETIRAEIRVKLLECEVETGSCTDLKEISLRQMSAAGGEKASTEKMPGPVLAAAPGNYGVAFARQQLGLSEEMIVKCSNFIGETLDACCEYGLSGLLLVGNAGKLIKVAAGVMNTHSSYADARIETMIACALEAGAPIEILREISGCVTTEAAFSLLQNAGFGQCVMDVAARRAADYLARRVRNAIRTGIILFSTDTGLSASGGSAQELLGELRKRNLKSV